MLQTKMATHDEVMKILLPKVALEQECFARGGQSRES
jgi:hypothetical protein